MIINKGIPAQAVGKARKVLTEVRHGKVYPRKLANRRYESLAVSRNYRLVRPVGGTEWELMSHESYNTKVNR